MFKMYMQWKEFNVDLRTIDANLRSLYGSYTGCNTGYSLELIFEAELNEDQQADIQAYWDGLDEESEEAQNYQSAAEIEEQRLAKKASGKAKLIALGLSEEEANALLG